MSAGLALIPGTGGLRDDARIIPDIAWIERTFHVRVTAGYSTDPVHKSAGDHPKGLAIDVVPGAGGSWDDVDRLAAFAAKHKDVFRFVGYDGRFGTTKWPGHGRGNHLHLSWHGGGTAGDKAPLKLVTGGDKKSLLDQVVGGIVDEIKHPLTGGANNPTHKLPDKAEEAAKAGAQAALQGIWDLAQGKAGEALLWTALVGGGTALAVYGLIRALGQEENVKRAVTAVATRGAVR